jgi:hypothetical protein
MKQHLTQKPAVIHHKTLKLLQICHIPLQANHSLANLWQKYADSLLRSWVRVLSSISGKEITARPPNMVFQPVGRFGR